MQFRGSKVDLTIHVSRDKLIGILTDNRQKHEAEFKKSMEGYRTLLLEHAEENLERAKLGEHPHTFPHRPPQSYLPQYDRALSMLNLTDDDQINLSAYDHARFVEDDWDWKADFVGASQTYAK